MIGEANDNKNGLMNSLFYNYNKGLTDFSSNSETNQYAWNYIKLIELKNVGVNGFISVTSHYASDWAKRPMAILPFMFRSYKTGSDSNYDFTISKLMANSYISDVHFYYVFEEGKSTIYCSKTSKCSVNALVLHSDNYWRERATVYNENVDSLPDGAVEISY